MDHEMHTGVSRYSVVFQIGERTGLRFENTVELAMPPVDPNVPEQRASGIAVVTLSEPAGDHRHEPIPPV